MAETADAVAAQVDTARRLGARLITVVGTAVLRSAPNADELAAEVARMTGFPLRVLSEEAEAELSFLGATSVVGHREWGRSRLPTWGVGRRRSRSAARLQAGLVALDGDRLGAAGQGVPRDRSADPRGAGRLPRARSRGGPRLKPPQVDAALAVGGAQLAAAAGGRATGRSDAGARAAPAGVMRMRAEVARDHEMDVRRVKLLPAGIAILAAVSGLLGVPLQVARGGLREGVILRLAEAQD